MFKRFTLGLLCSCALLVLLVSLDVASAPRALAAPHLPASGGGGSCTLVYGVSYDANTFSTITYSGGVPMAVFSFAGSNAPVVASYEACMENSTTVYFLLTGFSTGWFNILTTASNQTTQTTYETTLSVSQMEAWGGHYEFFQNLQPHMHYTFQFQSCYALLFTTRCTSWSPKLEQVTYTNINCQSGYVWRGANFADQVCVTPAEQAQVALDNSLASSRVDPNGAYGPHTCVVGYVWRQAFGGDYVCVTPAQRNQVAQDNSLATSRMVAP